MLRYKLLVAALNYFIRLAAIVTQMDTQQLHEMTLYI